MFGSVGQTMKAATVLDGAIKLQMNPLQLRKAGAIIENMQNAEYTDEQINHICRALFLDQTEDDMRPAWGVFDKEGEGSLSAADFKLVLPLLGEEVPEEEIAQLFKEADSDGSGDTSSHSTIHTQYHSHPRICAVPTPDPQYVP